MSTDRALDMGAAAFESGVKRRPTCDYRFLALYAPLHQQARQPERVALLDAWFEGYDMARETDDRPALPPDVYSVLSNYEV